MGTGGANDGVVSNLNFHVIINFLVMNSMKEILAKL